QPIDPELLNTLQASFPASAHPMAEVLSKTLPANGIFLYPSLNFALQMHAQGESIETTLQRVNEIAVQNLADAEARGDQTTITIAPAVLAEESVVTGAELRFGTDWFNSVFEPDAQLLENVIAKFTETDHEID